MFKHAALRLKRRLPVTGTENGKLRFSVSCICIHGRVREKWEFPIKRWEGMPKVRLIMYSAVCTETTRESAPLFSRCKPGCKKIYTVGLSQSTLVKVFNQKHKPIYITCRIPCQRALLSLPNSHCSTDTEVQGGIPESRLCNITR